MKSEIRIFLCNDDGEKFFGEGPYQLLVRTKRTGSLRSAAAEMGMAYTKAHALISFAEKNLGFELTHRKIGGKGGGGSVLTDEAQELISRYERYKKECKDFASEKYKDIFETTE